MNKIFLMIISLIFVSCDELEGKFNVLAPDVKLVNTKGKLIEFSEGVYTSILDFESSSEIELEIKSLSGEGQYFTFKIPSNISLPEQSGSFSITSEDLSQPYDLLGSVRTDYERGEVITGYENCSYRLPYTHCHHTPHGSYCETRYRIEFGERFIEYQVQRKVKNFTLNLLRPKTEDVSSFYEGLEIKESRLYSFKGSCR